MYKNIFILLILLSSILSAIPTLDINSNSVKIDDFKLEYFVDKTNNMQFKEVKNRSLQRVQIKHHLVRTKLVHGID